MLGAFRVHVDDELVVETAWRRRKGRQLSKLLVGRAARRLLKGEAIEVLWPRSDPAAASTNLRTTVRALRHGARAGGAGADAAPRAAGSPTRGTSCVQAPGRGAASRAGC